MPKARNVIDIDVRDAPYRAAGDDATNDRAAIQKAVDDVSAAGSGTVVLRSGRTFLSGEIRLKSGVVLRVDGILKKSNDPSHYGHPAIFGRMVPDTAENWDLCSYHNYPLIYTAAGTTDIAVRGSGALDMNHTGDDNTTIQAASIGLYDTERFVIEGITIVGACQPQVWPVRCRHGEVVNVRIANPAPGWNNEAICMCNCQDMHIHHNHSVCGDDNIDIWSSYRDRRMHVWCSSEDPQPSINIEIDHNTLGQTGNGACINIVPWGAHAPDQELVRIDNISIHDNTFLPFVGPGTYHTRFRYQEWNERSTYGHSPLSNFRIHGNGIGSDSMHDGSEPRFPCAGFETNDFADPWFTDAVRNSRRQG